MVNILLLVFTMFFVVDSAEELKQMPTCKNQMVKIN